MSDADSPFFPALDFNPNDRPDDRHERLLGSKGIRYIAGVDEAGRGPIAGPVVAAAVILNLENQPDGLNDSKKLTTTKREALFVEICEKAHVSFAVSPPEEIDQVNILQATFRAMCRSVKGLPITPDHTLIDGRDVPRPLIGKASAMIMGDGRSVSIAAASIIAKVVRDRMMVEAHTLFPEYGFDGHKGYGSKRHMEAIHTLGPCRLHRKSFAPIRDM